MAHYDSLIIGYGLTIHIYNEISKRFSKLGSIRNYLNFNNYLRDFIFKKDPSWIWHDFNTRFDGSSHENIKERLESRYSLKCRYDDICEYGFERWVSKYLFDKKNNVEKGLISFVYFLYNHWADLLWKQVLSKNEVKTFICKVANNISSMVGNGNIFTTNYDVYLNDILNVKHLHGKFKLPLLKFSEIITPMRNDPDRIEYSYLFGGGGIEKDNRLNDIENMCMSEYDLEFFRDNELNLGTLLIYGLSFSRTEYVTDEFILKYPKYKNDFYLLSVDGHILKKLNEKKNEGKLTKIYITYYKDHEKNYLENLFSMAGLNMITEFIDSRNVNFIS